MQRDRERRHFTIWELRRRVGAALAPVAYRRQLNWSLVEIARALSLTETRARALLSEVDRILWPAHENAPETLLVRAETITERLGREWIPGLRLTPPYQHKRRGLA